VGSTELYSLNECTDCLVKFVKKSGGVQYNLPATLKSGGKTQPWCSLISKISSILTSFDAWRPLLRDRKRDDLLDVVLLEEVLKRLRQYLIFWNILTMSLYNLFCQHTICFAIIGQICQPMIVLQGISLKGIWSKLWMRRFGWT